MSGQLTVSGLFNPFNESQEASRGLRALMLGMVVVFLLVAVAMVWYQGNLSAERTQILLALGQGAAGQERVEAGYNWRGGAAGASTGFMSQTSDSLLGGTGHGQGQSVRLDKVRGERLVGGGYNWPVQSEGTAMVWSPKKSPCGGAADAANAANSNTNSTSVMRPAAGAAPAAPAGQERFSAVWQHENLSSRDGHGSAFENLQKSRVSRDHAKAEADLMDILHHGL